MAEAGIQDRDIIKLTGHKDTSADAAAATLSPAFNNF